MEACADRKTGNVRFFTRSARVVLGDRISEANSSRPTSANSSAKRSSANGTTNTSGCTASRLENMTFAGADMTSPMGSRIK